MDDLMDDLMNVNLYEILGVDEYCDAVDIKKKYKSLAIKCHPDKNPDDQDLFELITLAYNTLSNDELRQRYDDIRNSHTEWDFKKLKEGAQSDLKEALPISDIEIKKFTEENIKLNIKHGVTEDEPIDIAKITKRLHELYADRKILENELLKQDRVNLETYFEGVNREDDKEVKQDIIEYNTSSTWLNSVHHMSSLYDEGPSILEDSFKLQTMGTFKEEDINFEDRIKDYYNEGKKWKMDSVTP